MKTDLIIKKCKNGSHYSSEFSVWVQIKCIQKQFLLFVARLTDKNKEDDKVWVKVTCLYDTVVARQTDVETAGFSLLKQTLSG